MLNIHQHRRIHQIYLEHDTSIVKTQQVFNLTYPESTLCYQMTRYWIQKPLPVIPRITNHADHIFLGLMCGIKPNPSPTKTNIRIPKKTPDIITKIIHNHHKIICPSLPITNNSICHEPLVSMINYLLELKVLGLESSIYETFLHIDDLDEPSFNRGYVLGKCSHIEETSIKLKNTHETLSHLQNMKHLRYEKKYTSLIVNGYSAERLYSNLLKGIHE